MALVPGESLSCIGGRSRAFTRACCHAGNGETGLDFGFPDARRLRARRRAQSDDLEQIGTPPPYRPYRRFRRNIPLSIFSYGPYGLPVAPPDRKAAYLLIGRMA